MPRKPDAGDDDAYLDMCERAVSIAAMDLGLDPDAFAVELAQGEIGLLITYLRSAAPGVEDPELQANIEALLHRLTTWTRRSS